MTVQFIFLATAAVFLLLIIGFIIKLSFLTIISSIGVIVIGISTLIYGMGSINNILTLGIGIISVLLGSYIFLESSLEEIKNMI